jgi:UDP-glucose 4-epimerase
VTGDLLESGTVLDRLCDGADTVVHLAGPNEMAATRDPEGTITEVVRGTLRLAAAAERLGVRRAIYVSTVHVYGTRLLPGATVTEETPCEPRSAYAIARLVAEHLLASSGPSDVVVLRLTNSVGAPASPAVDRWSLVANDLCRQGVTEGILHLRTSGTQWRDFLSLTEVCRVIGECARRGKVAPGTYNLGSGVPMTVRALAAAIQRAFVVAGKSCPPLDAPDPESDPPAPYRVSVDKLRAAGLRVEGNVTDALLETVQFCLEHRRDLVERFRP